MAELLYAVEVVDAPQRETRFATFREGGHYSGTGDIIWVTSTKALTKPQSVCRQITDDLREAAANGTSHAYLGSARVVCYHPDTKRWETVYTGKEVLKLRAQKAAPKNAQDWQGYWRVVPVTGFHQGQRETVFRAGFTDSDGYPKAIEITGQTEYEIVEKMFNSIYVVHREFVKTLPFSSPEDVAIAEAEIAAANAPKVGRQYVFRLLQTHANRFLTADTAIAGRSAVRLYSERRSAQPNRGNNCVVILWFSRSTAPVVANTPAEVGSDWAV
jgi:hypothetical protein